MANGNDAALRQRSSIRSTKAKRASKRAGSTISTGTQDMASKTIKNMGRVGTRSANSRLGLYRGYLKNITPAGWREIACHGIAASFGLAVVLPIMVMLFDRDQPFTLYNATTEPSPAIPGKPLVITFEVDVVRQCEGEVVRSIVDHTGRVFTFKRERTWYHEALATGRVKFTREIIVPIGSKPGSATFHADVTRWCNSLQKIFHPIRAHFQIGFEVAETKLDKLLEAP